ncbi:hypothetical protein ABD78_04695 [Paenibacillus polymyxa]|uniref:Uncharacterized protein n=2 Tax=Paenibacillus polymyxa TaxID=1406 RepID=A0A378XUT9_PAEPO|nr:hypothetical protein [Paenibacillus polymyxa]SUA68394.1 Uncharacterised protein [Paenibacillus polymyxa]
MCSGKEDKKMQATEIKPIRQTQIFFENETDYKNFIEYATSRKKTDNEIMNRVRKELKDHVRSAKRK